MFVAGANRNLQILAEKGFLIDDLIVAEQIVQSRIESFTGGGANNPDSFLISSIDGLRFPIQKAFYVDGVASSPPNELDSIRKVVDSSLPES
jgi:hypothetical protein